VGGEASVQGFCTCLEDGDCPRDRCDANGKCSITQRECNPADSNSCRNIYCKQVKVPLEDRWVGYCHIGNNCAPVEGVTCDDVRAQQSN